MDPLSVAPVPVERVPVESVPSPVEPVVPANRSVIDCKPMAFVWHKQAKKQR